jgi:hypothetical protein
MPMRPVVAAKLFILTLFGLYLAFGFAHSTGEASPTRANARYGPE